MTELWYHTRMNTHRPNNREVIRKVNLSDEDGSYAPDDSTAAERLQMVWRMTQECLAFVPGHNAQRAFQRHVIRVERRER